MRFFLVLIILMVGAGMYLYTVRHPPAAPPKTHQTLPMKST
jgi:hypothetical protein